MSSPETEGKKKEKKPLHVYPDIKVETRFFSHHGLDSTRYNGVNALTGSIVLMAAGRFVMFVNVRSGEINSMQGPENGGVSAVAVHPSREFFVLCERAPKDPLIRVYRWPSRQEEECFRGGAVRGFSACGFSADGQMMATVSTAPDFSLAVWNWETRGMILRSKCTATDVHSVVFSRFDSGLLVTGGSGHVKFWTMATTFTGQKLQGLLGNFGRLDISNISGFAVLSDGKVLSGSEGGFILLWEGDVVRCSFAREVHQLNKAGGALAVQNFSYVPCHKGTIHVVLLLESEQVLLTAGDDGYMRYWRVSELDTAEGEGAPPFYTPKCLLEVLVDASACIRAVTHCRDTNEWVVLDSMGAIWRVPYIAPDHIIQSTSVDIAPAVPALQFNGGAITSAALSPRDHTIVTGGEDGTIRLVDYISSRELFRMRLGPNNGVVALRFFFKETSGNTFMACTGSGSVLLLRREPRGFTLIGQWRPHLKGILVLAVDRAEKRVCTVTSDGMLFFFDVAPDFSGLQPIGFCNLPLGNVTCAAWDDASDSVLIGCASGQLLAVRAPVLADVDHTIGYEAPCAYSLVGLRQRKQRERNPIEDARAAEKGDEELEDDEEDASALTWPLRCVAPLPDGTFAVGAEGNELLYSYTTRVRYAGRTDLPPLPPTGIEPPDYVEEPMANLCYRDCTPLAVSMSASERFLVVLCDGAVTLLRPVDAMGSPMLEVSAAQHAHDSLEGHVTAVGVSFDDTMCVSVASDGLVVAQLRSGCAQPQRVVERKVIHAEESAPPKPLSLSIQQQKEEDDRQRAEDAKQRDLDGFLAKLHVLRARYAEIMKENAALPVSAQLQGDEAALHPLIAAELSEERERRITEARRDTALEIAREDVRTRKMRHRFLDTLLTDRFVVHSFSGDVTVASFRTADPSAAVSHFESVIAELRAEDMASRPRRDTDALSEGARGDSDSDSDAGSAEAPAEKPAGSAASGGGGPALAAAMRQYFDKIDERREERARRRRGHEALLARRPATAAEIRRLEREVAQAVARRGECILRTDTTYRAGGARQQPSAAAKLEQLVRLEALLVDLRNEFNTRLATLRTEKSELCDSVNALLRRMSEIDAALPGSAANDTSPFALVDDECPEKRLEVDRAGLDVFADEVAQARAREELAKKAQRAFGADLADGSRPGTENGTSNARITPHRHASGDETDRRVSGGARGSKGGRNLSSSANLLSRGSRQQSTVFSTAVLRERKDHEVRAKLENVKLTEAEEEEVQADRERLMAERRTLNARVRRALDEFDAKLWSMYEERARVDSDLCLAHARALLLFHEYEILLVFRQRDRELQSQQNEARAARDALRLELTSQRESVCGHDSALERLNETARAFRHEVEAFIESNFPAEHVSYVTRVFLRHIKRRRHGGDADEDDDDLTSDEDDDAVDDDIGEEVCPPGCAEERWLDVLAKRETRLDHVDALQDLRQRKDAAQRRIDEHVALAAEKDAAVAQCRREIAEFQSEKQRQLNLLDTLVSLHCGQVRCLDEAAGRCPASFRLDELVVVSDAVVGGLRQRIVRLAGEKHECAVDLRAMAADHVQRQRARAEWRDCHAKWEERVYDAMMLKFGQVVDLDLLESASGNRAVEELREKLRAEEVRCEAEIRRRDRRIVALRGELQSGLERNTHLLHDLGDQEDDRQEVDRSLSQATQKVVSKIYDGANVATAADRKNLRLLIAAQKEEIDALQVEIKMLRRKGGHVYAPSTQFTGVV